MRYSALLLFFTLALAGCESKAPKVQQLLKQYNETNAVYQRDCAVGDSSGAARMLTGEKLTAEQMAALDAKKKAQEARCKPQADRLADIQRQILAAQQ
jgi:hypothetical protein